MKNGNTTVNFSGNQTTEKLPFGTIVEWKVEKIGFDTQNGTFTILDEEFEYETNKVVVPELQSKARVSKQILVINNSIAVLNKIC